MELVTYFVSSVNCHFALTCSDGICALLGVYAASSGNRLPTFRHNRSDLQGSWSKMGPIGCPETSVKDYHSTLRNIPEERRYRQHRGGSLRSRMCYDCVCVTVLSVTTFVTVLSVTTFVTVLSVTTFVTVVSYDVRDISVSYDVRDSSVSYDVRDSSVSYDVRDTSVSYDVRDSSVSPIQSQTDTAVGVPRVASCPCSGRRSRSCHLMFYLGAGKSPLVPSYENVNVLLYG
jgi:hypothetical protein